MKTLRLTEEASQEDLESIAKLVARSRRIMALTGAGISKNAGIPDFRSSSGLYRQNYQGSHLNCKQLFDVSIYRDPGTIGVFNKFMEKMYYGKVKRARPTRTHRFLRALNEHHKLMHCFTQNIDGLERKVGMSTEFDNLGDWTSTDVIQLHGDLATLRCNRCLAKYTWNEIYVNQKGAEEDAGLLIACPRCEDEYHTKQNAGKRCCASSIGIIRPNIVLYGEEHPYGEVLAKGLQRDIGRKPKVFLIFGTSLKVVGVKSFVRKMAKAVHSAGGTVVVVNKSPLCQSSWGEYIDFQVLGDCDEWCKYTEQRMPRVFPKRRTRSASPPVKRLKVKRAIAVN